VLPGAWNTIVLAQIALVGMGVLALLLFPLVSRRFMGTIGQPAGRVLLVVVRSTPEYMLAYVLLQLLGPSMLPAAIALAVHNGAIVGYLMGRHADALDYRATIPRRASTGSFWPTASIAGRSSCARVPSLASWAWRHSATTWMPPSPSCASTLPWS
jgi:phosphonate transport system permease protein